MSIRRLAKTLSSRQLSVSKVHYHTFSKELQTCQYIIPCSGQGANAADTLPESKHNSSSDDSRSARSKTRSEGPSSRKHVTDIRHAPGMTDMSSLMAARHASATNRNKNLTQPCGLIGDLQRTETK